MLVYSRSGLDESGLKRSHKHKDPTTHGFWNPACLKPSRQTVGSLCLCAFWGP